MTVEEIKEKIKHYEDIIDGINSEKTEIDSQLDELERLREKIVGTQNKLALMKEKTDSKVANKLGKKVRNNIFVKYLNGLQGMMSGKEFADSYDGLTEAKQKVNSEMRILLDKIDDCDTRLADNEEQKSYWMEQLRSVV